MTDESLDRFTEALQARGMTAGEVNERIAALNVGIEWGICKGVISVERLAA